MRWAPLFAIIALAIAVLAGCTSVAEEIRHKCATAANPGECEKAEYARLHAADSESLNVTKGAGGGY